MPRGSRGEQSSSSLEEDEGERHGHDDAAQRELQPRHPPLEVRLGVEVPVARPGEDVAHGSGARGADEWLARIMSPVGATSSGAAETAARLGRERVARARQERAQRDKAIATTADPVGARVRALIDLEAAVEEASAGVERI